jgi:hypothetical protein
LEYHGMLDSSSPSPLPLPFTHLLYGSKL